VWMPRSQERLWKTSAVQNGLTFTVLLPSDAVAKKILKKFAIRDVTSKYENRCTSKEEIWYVWFLMKFVKHSDFG
jgi:hypothetical protein